MKTTQATHSDGSFTTLLPPFAEPRKAGGAYISSFDVPQPIELNQLNTPYRAYEVEQLHRNAQHAEYARTNRAGY